MGKARDEEGALAEIERLDKEVERFGDSWEYFIRLFQNRRGNGTPLSPWMIAITALDARQVGNLDAVRAVTHQGRPSAAGALLRGMYETMVGVLLMGFADELGPDDKGRNWSRDELADRFRAYGMHARLQQLEFMRRHTDGSVLIDVFGSEENLAQALATFESERDRYGFKDGSANWHPFGGMHKVKDRLWPSAGNPVFPPEILPLDRRGWENLYFTCWRNPSHDVHGGYASLTQMFVYDGDGLVDAGRAWDPMPLSLALQLAWVTAAAYTTAIDCQGLWVEALDGRPHWISDPRWNRSP